MYTECSLHTQKIRDETLTVMLTCTGEVSKTNYIESPFLKGRVILFCCNQWSLKKALYQKFLGPLFKVLFFFFYIGPTS